ncbi:MAG: ABC transporter ATP-binding protein [Planctomycetes bacterium]|nr:ABC transporter ATP-binding protein [Planctomycetota bacterium]
MPHIVQVSSVQKHIKTKNKIIKAVDSVSFACEKGKIFGLLGPNGAGKTTLLRMLATLLKPTSGQILVNGIDIAQQPIEAKKTLSYMSEETKLYEKLTVKELLSFIGSLYGLKNAVLQDRIDFYLNEFEITEFQNMAISRLSSGMKQKLNLIRCILHEPEVVILDEPTSNLDVVASQLIFEMLKQLKQRNKCIIISSHNMLQAQKLCDTFFIINKGRVVQQGDLKEITSKTDSADLEEAFLKTVRE